MALFDRALVGPAIVDSFRKLSPATQWRNPVMFVVYVGSILTTLLWVQAIFGQGEAPAMFIFAITIWLWFTLLFANFAEALAEGRSKAQAASLRGVKTSVAAKKLSAPKRDASVSLVPASDDAQGRPVYLVEADEIVPADGEVVVGAASVDESAITGESAPVIREAGGDFSSVTGGTRLLSDWLVVRVSANPGESFLDRMIAMVEGAKRQKTPNEIALTILLVVLTLVFLLATATLLPFSHLLVRRRSRRLPPGAGVAAAPVTITVLVALLVCLIPTTIGGLLSAIGVAGMGRMLLANVIAKSGRAVEAAGDVDVLLLDKTGTITLGNRQASGVHAGARHQRATTSCRARCSRRWPTRRRKVAASSCSPNQQGFHEDRQCDAGATFVPFTAQTRMSGVDLGSREIRKGSVDAVRKYVEAIGCQLPVAASSTSPTSSRARDRRRWSSSTPIAAARSATVRVLGVDRAEGHRQAGPEGTLRRTASHGHPHGDDHRRQPPDRRGHRGRSGRRRLPRRSHAGDEAQADPRHAGRRSTGRDDRRRHQRRAGARAGRRRRRDELGHAAREGGRQHGRPRLATRRS